MLGRFCVGVLALASVAALVGCQGLVKGVSQLTVNVAGAGSGTVTSTPNGINCPTTCSATFQGIAQVTLTATPGTGFGFAGWNIAERRHLYPLRCRFVHMSLLLVRLHEHPSALPSFRRNTSGSPSWSDEAG